MILAVVDTSTRFAGVGVMDNAGNRVIRSWRSNQNHGRELMPALAESLAELTLKPNEITHVAVALGPGGFSAVRVGISATLGLAVAKGLPVLGIPTHEIEFEPFRTQVTKEKPIYSLIPAGRGEFSWMRHAPDSENQTGVAAPADFVERLEDGATLCGEACDLMIGLVDPERFRSPMQSDSGTTRDPNAILDIAVTKFNAGFSTPFEELRPIYARAPSISKPKPRK